jgi:hypothetical protein
MTNRKPSRPKPPNPEKYDTWIDDDGELYVFDGTEWAPYLSPPGALDGDLKPVAVERDQ